MTAIRWSRQEGRQQSDSPFMSFFVENSTLNSFWLDMEVDSTVVVVVVNDYLELDRVMTAAETVHG